MKETIEEAAERTYSDKLYPMYGGLRRDAFINGYKLAQERSYSEEEVLELLTKAHFVEQNIVEWFEKNKKK